MGHRYLTTSPETLARAMYLAEHPGDSAAVSAWDQLSSLRDQYIFKANALIKSGGIIVTGEPEVEWMHKCAVSDMMFHDGPCDPRLWKRMTYGTDWIENDPEDEDE